VEELVVRFARDNRGWGYDRIVGALANLGHAVSDCTVGTSCAGTISHRRRSERVRPPGRSLSDRMWRCWRAPTSSPLRC
jgi:hypothetical protein